MTTEYPGRGDLARTAQLLWGIVPPPRRGPRPQLTIEQVVVAAIEVADGEGLDGLSMRRVADRLGMGTMSLYRYVPSKAELLDVMVDRVCGETDRRPVAGRWRARLEHVARENRRLFEHHPWLLYVFPGRPPLGPGMIGKYEDELRSIDGIGLTETEMDLVVNVVVGYVRGATLTVVETAQAQARTGLSDDDWWRAVAPTLETVFDPAEYPTATRVGAVAAEDYGAVSDPDVVFEFGLRCVLDGIEALVAKRRRRRTSTRPG
jgi:AcrR family transcriptional regulator